MSNIQTDARPIGAPKLLLTPSDCSEQENQITLTDEKFELFIERKDLPQGAFEYDRNAKDPGLVLVFNQESFEDKSYRIGSRRDVNEIITCMSRLGFNVNKKYIFTDLSKDAIIETIDEICKMDLADFNCLIFFFLSHGDSYNRLYASDVYIEAADLWKPFVDCPGLKNKPKMFIFQACKGDLHSTVASETVPKRDLELVPPQTFQSDYFGPDMLVVYSTTEGNVSFRNAKTGTWFIQELCKNFAAYGRRDDVLSLLMRTTKCICVNYYHLDDDGLKKQSPIFISTLRRKFYLNRTKERNILIHILKEQERMKEKVNELEQKLEELLQDKLK